MSPRVTLLKHSALDEQHISVLKKNRVCQRVKKQQEFLNNKASRIVSGVVTGDVDNYIPKQIKRISSLPFDVGSS